MSDIIEWVLEMEVQDGQADNVQPLLDEMVAACKANEPGAIHYEYYMPDDRSTCTVLERYADNAAVMTHMANFGEKFAERFTTCFGVTRFSVFGNTDATVQGALAGFGATHQKMVSGFHR